METLSLDGAWEFRRVGDKKWYPATVPGCDFTDLLASHRIPDPFEEDNELKVRWVVDSDWEYRRSFDIDDALLQHDRVLLDCDGLDTLAAVRINGKEIASSKNMFVPLSANVKRALKTGKNDISIRFRSPVKYAAPFVKKRRKEMFSCRLPAGPFVRKAPSHFGWDWGPKLPPAGIWRSVRLTGRNVACMEDVHIRQAHRGRKVAVSAAVKLGRWAGGKLKVAMTLTHPDGVTQAVQATVLAPRDVATLRIDVRHPQLWWPNGLGGQPLYTFRVALLADNNAVLDEQTGRIGLRTVELRRRKDAAGESFEFVVNGVAVFAKGANWIPADSFPNRVGREKYRYLVTSAAEAHMNMLRVWGGGFYEDEAFYDLCDELGMLVWQDFMFACNVYPTDKAFVENVRREVVANVRRLRHRACLALWCGNNELEQGWSEWGWSEQYPKSARDGYRTLFHKLMRKWVAAGDPDTEYWPGSPCSGRPLKNPNDESKGDAHFWGVWHGRKPFTEYRKYRFRFVSEFGFQSFPCIETVTSYAKPEDWNATSYIMEHHQRSGSGNGLIVGYMTDTFRLPRSFDDFCYVSQLLQAEAIRYGVEHWRRGRQRTSGTLYWQLNDCWPVASWSSIDYFGRWKALHYAAKRFYAPVLLSARDTGTKVALHVTNDTARPFKGTVRWTLETVEGEILRDKHVNVVAKSEADTRVAVLNLARDITDANRRRVVLVYELHSSREEWISGGVVPFVPDKHLALANPGLTWQVSDRGNHWAITLRARLLARFVEIKLRGMDSLWSDNYFDLPAGRPRTVTCAKVEGVTLSDIRAGLQIRSLYNSF